MKLREAGLILKNKASSDAEIKEAEKRMAKFKAIKDELNMERLGRHLANNGTRFKSGSKKHQSIQPRNEKPENKPYLGFRPIKRKKKKD